VVLVVIRIAVPVVIRIAVPVVIALWLARIGFSFVTSISGVPWAITTTASLLTGTKGQELAMENQTIGTRFRKNKIEKKMEKRA
jgi:ACR3 family arsenite efflux pump ArsB